MDFQAMCDRYFEELSLDEDGKKLKIARPYLTTGLALHLGMSTETLLQYSDKPEFSSIVKKAKDKISLGLQEGSIMNPKSAVGYLFNLKCNHGMVEKKQVEISGPGGGPIRNEVEYVDPRDEE